MSTGNDLALRFLQLRSEFRKMGIEKPMPFILWRRPALTGVERSQLTNALCGKVLKKYERLIPVVEGVLEELKAA